jgi:hypothetical protein
VAGSSSTAASGIMLEAGLKQLLSRDEEPGDFYQLVGMPRLCRDREKLLSSIEEASEYLFECQNHKDKSIRDRARKFHRQVADARRVVSDDSRWEQYDQDLIERLRTLCLKNPDFSGQHPKLDDLKRWLALVQKVDSQRVEELIPILTTEPPAKKPKSKPPVEMETRRHLATPTEVLPSLRERDSRPESSALHAVSSFESSAIPEQPAVASQTRDAAKPPLPPQGPRRDGGIKSPPPPPRELPRQAQSPTQFPAIVTSSQPVPSVLDQLKPASAGSPVLWIIMAAFLTALVLGMLALILAWASGAFERGRSRAGLPTIQGRMVSQSATGGFEPIPFSFLIQIVREGIG